MRKLLSCLVALSIASTFTIAVTSAQDAWSQSVKIASVVGNQFKDVKSNHWAGSAIIKANADGLVKGYQDGTFRPNANVTRAEMAAVIVRASKMGAPAEARAVFNDVPNSYWGAAAINQAVEMGFINPRDYNGKFAPNTAMTRYELACWLSNGLAASHPSFAQALKDTKNTIVPFTEYFRGGISKTQAPYLSVALGSGVIGGFPDGSFGMDKPTTRAEMVAMMYRYLAVEGRDASQFKALNELREVGTTGTNLVSMGAKWGTNYQGEEANFSQIRGQKLQTRNYVGTVIPHFYIVVDTYLDNPTSVYGDMFRTARRGTGFSAFVDMTFTPSRDGVTTNSLSDGIGFLTGSTINTPSVAKYGYKTLPRDYGRPESEYQKESDFLKSGVSRRVWVSTLVVTGPFAGPSVGSKMMTFQLTK